MKAACTVAGGRGCGIRTLRENGTAESVPRPRNMPVVGTRWTYRVKENPDGTIAKFKARLVAKSYAQRQGVNYGEIFAPVARMVSICTLLAWATERGLKAHQMDVSSAFLQGTLDAVVHCEPPQGTRQRNLRYLAMFGVY